MNTTLTREEKRERIALACGWSLENYRNEFDEPKCRWVSPAGERQGSGCVSALPDFFADLNACREMEKVLTTEQRYDYSAAFISLDDGSTCAGWDIAHASADQKSEIFGRTLGLW